MSAAALRSGKGASHENFPVASWLIRRQHRPVILAFYDFVRTADDVADHAGLSADDKLAHLESLERSLLGRSEDQPEGVALAMALQQRQLDARHARDLLRAFRQDVAKDRYATFDDLIDYCRLSAMPVGRFVLDVHGESRSLWPAADALCAALQLINHLQDCGSDFRKLNRVYLPLDMLERHDAAVEMLGDGSSPPPLRACLRDLTGRTEALLAQSAALPNAVADRWLAMEIAAIRTMAVRLVGLLRVRDPLSEPVHLNKAEALLRMAAGGVGVWPARRPPPHAERSAPQRLPVGAPASAAGDGRPAHGSSFYLAMRLLRREQREAMFQIYTFCRAVDDIADGTAPRADRLAQLADWRSRIDAIFDGNLPHGLETLAAVVRRFGLRRQDFHAVIDGMAMDAEADIRSPALSQLELYCDRVACAVGRLSVRIFGLDPIQGDALAYHLGSALQLTNILRDIDEDAALGRVYLPREALQAAGIAAVAPTAIAASDRLDAACRYLAVHAMAHFDRADTIMARCDRRSVRPARIMGAVYRRMLGTLLQRGWGWPRDRVRLNRPRLIWIALRHAFV